MKRLASITIFSSLAAALWAAPVAPTAALPMQGTACPTPAPQPDPAKLTWKGGATEYNDFVAITKATTPAAQAPLAESFVKKYPNSDYLNEALMTEAGDLAQSGQFAPAVAAAETLMKSPGATAQELLAADMVIAVADPNLIQPNDPDMQNKLAVLKEAASCGEQLAASAPAASKAQYTAAFTKAMGFDELTGKDFANAITTLTQATQQNPKDALPYYWLGVAQVTKDTPDFNDGLYNLAKATVLSNNAATIKNYLTTVYTNYHGSADGLQDILTAAQNNAGPVPVKSATDILNEKNMEDYQKQLEIQKNTLPPADSFPGIKARLLQPDKAPPDFWKTNVKGQGLELDGIVKDIGVGGKTIDIAVGATDPSAPADLHVSLITPLSATKRPKVGDKVTVDGVADSFKVTGNNVLINFITGWVKGFQEAPK